MWLGELFQALGCEAIPALNCRQAQKLAKQLGLPIEVLVVNPELPGARRMVRQVAASNAGVRVVLIGNGRELHSGNGHNGHDGHPGGTPVRFMLERPSPDETICRAKWLGRLRRILPRRADR